MVLLSPPQSVHGQVAACPGCVLASAWLNDMMPGMWHGIRGGSTQVCWVTCVSGVGIATEAWPGLCAAKLSFPPFSLHSTAIRDTNAPPPTHTHVQHFPRCGERTPHRGTSPRSPLTRASEQRGCYVSQCRPPNNACATTKAPPPSALAISLSAPPSFCDRTNLLLFQWAPLWHP